MVFASASGESGMYRLNCNVKATVETAMIANVESNQDLWHKRRRNRRRAAVPGAAVTVSGAGATALVFTERKGFAGERSP
jgi:hypothetical protein